MKEFVDKVALITGAGSGIGFEIAHHFYKKGATVYINDINEDYCKSAVEKINDAGRCFAFPGDAGRIAFIHNMVSSIQKKSGKIDIVVANAGITLFKSTLEILPEELDKIINLNIKGTFFLLQACAKKMIAQEIKGKLIVMSSITGRRAHKDLTAYGMTKAALESLVQNLVLDLSAYGITVNAIAPGATLTERTLEDKSYKEIWSKLTPMGRPSTTSDIANVALFLASNKADQITGQTVVVDGGWSAFSPGPM